MKAIKRYLKFCLTFKGRLNRKTFILSFFGSYFFVMLAGFLMAVLLPALLIFAQKVAEERAFALVVLAKSLTWIFILLSISAILIAVIGLFSFQVRRMHDLNFSGWWLVLVFIFSAGANVYFLKDPEVFISPDMYSLSIIIILFSIYLAFGVWILCIRGTKGENKYGSDPLQPALAQSSSEQLLEKN